MFGPREAGRKHGHIAGNKPTKTYYAYQSAKGRCHNPRHAKFGNYGARGIEMCERWRSGFVHFLADMGEAPEGGTLERRDNEKGYEPDNCIWAPVTVQHRNKRTTHNVEAEGKTWMAKDYARHAGVRYTSLLRLLSKGLDATEAAARLRLTATKTLPAPQEV